MRLHFTLDTPATPEQAFRAFTDFGARRLEVWKITLDPSTYRVLEHGETNALVCEGTPRFGIWNIERYDWSEPGHVTWATEHSNYCRGGGAEVRIAPAEGGGSRLTVTWGHDAGVGVRGTAVFWLQHLLARRLLPGRWAAAMARAAAMDDGARPPEP
ncbi:SRPBCC family protein [Sinomonas sp. P47F7]|uniref:SRPBCC family protein n=1 Tax=Sinomonas sp. P47F7 TaxID=3410987 RepID=UPI003BF4B794